MKKARGFQLIETMICVAMISLIAAIAIPSYQQHFIQANRVQAEIALSKLAVVLEQYYLTHNSYNGATLATLTFDSHVANHAYQLELDAQDQEYVASAVPLNNDAACGVLRLKANGEKSMSGNGKLSECW